MRMGVPDLDVITELVYSLLNENEIEEDAYFRISVSADSFGGLQSKTGSTATTITVARMARKTWLAEDRAIRLMIGPHQRAAEEVLPARVKCIANYAGARLATLHALQSGFDEAILIGGDGRLCEAPTANLFLVSNGVLRTPPANDRILPGITRAAILYLAENVGVPSRIETLMRSDAYTCEEAFLCGTGIEIAPIQSFDNLEVRYAKERPVTRALLECYFECVRSGIFPKGATEC
jgi:branched-chain amino acid aminotransferase